MKTMSSALNLLSSKGREQGREWNEKRGGGGGE